MAEQPTSPTQAERTTNALMRLRKVDEARALAEAFERAHPSDSYLARIRSLVAAAPAQKGR